MREMTLINGLGVRYDLFDIAKSPTSELEGLGYTDETDFIRIGDRWSPLEDVAAQRSFELILSFYGDADDRYYAFVDFARREPLTMVYTNDRGVFYIPCKLRSVTKPDHFRIQQYSCSVTFAVTGNPYKIVSGYNSGTASEGKTYPYTYPYTYSDDIANTVVLESDSYKHSPVILTIYGEAVNPVWRHYCNGILVESGALSGTLADGHYLVIDARSIPYSIIEYDSAGAVVADRYALCDFSTERFLHICEGENRYVVSHEGVDAIQLKVEAYIEYETV